MCRSAQDFRTGYTTCHSQSSPRGRGRWRPSRGPPRSQAPRRSRRRKGTPQTCGSGRLSHRPDRAFGLIGDLELRLERVPDRALGDDAALYLRPRGDLEHRVEQRLLDDRLQRARAGAAQQSQLGDRVERALLEHELDVVQREELLVLLHERVLRLGEDADDVLLVEVVQGDDDRQAADELGDEPVLQEVLRLQVLERLGDDALLGAVVRGAESNRPAADPLLDDLLQAVESATADEQDVGRVDLDEILVRVLAAALRRHVRDGSLEDLKQRLLHALAADVARDRRVVRLARDLVDLVDVDDSALGAADVEVRCLDEPQQDVLHVLADVAGLGEARRVGDGERNVEDLRQRLREVRLAAARRADEQDVRLGQLDVADRLRRAYALVVVVDLDREDLLRALLADDVLVERGADRLRVGDETSLLLLGARRAVVVLEDLLAEVDALVADEHAGPGDQLADLVLALSAEAAPGIATAVFSFVHWFLMDMTLRGCRRRGIMAPENLVGKAYALAADEDSRTGDQPDASLPLLLAAERALRSMPGDLVSLRPASEDHPAATFSLTFSSSLDLSLSTTPGLVGVRMMSSISPYSFAASAVRK